MTRATAERGRGRAGDKALGPTSVQALQGYLGRSQLPLTMLLFLLPMVVLYELGTRQFASDLVRQTETRVLAFSLVRQFMALFGATGRYLPCLAVVGILLTWHLACRHPWKLHSGTAALMLVESALLALPILALGNVLGQWLPLYAATGNWQGGIVLALGAGIYEELVFRLMAFTLLNILLIDLLGCAKKPAYVLMVVGSAVLFAAYHYWSPVAGPFRWSDFIFRTLSGVYFGVLFIVRGFGVTSGCHTAYDVYYFLLRALIPA